MHERSARRRCQQFVGRCAKAAKNLLCCSLWIIIPISNTNPCLGVRSHHIVFGDKSQVGALREEFHDGGQGIEKALRASEFQNELPDVWNILFI